MESNLVRYARECAQELLGPAADGPWGRCQRAGHRATSVVRALNRPRGEVIEAASWLHAIGHSPQIRGSGFAPVDGAVHLLAEGWPTPVVSLVAHQGQARLIAPAYGAVEQLTLFERIQGWPSDILDYAIVMAVSDEEHPDPEACLRREAQDLPGSTRVTARDRAERERRLRRAVDRVSAAMVAARSPARQGA